MPPSQRENLQRVTFVFLLNTSHLPDTYFPPELSSICVCSGNDVPGCRGKKQMQKNPLARENPLMEFPKLNYISNIERPSYSLLPPDFVNVSTNLWNISVPMSFLIF